ncbi:putative Serine/threonine-protein phosphatase 4 regulatory subunit 3 [Monoraphidium neglectum]|uniref:Putative Serine/threonine-protein phosphatase 4 regulatory subunit 3 n=1 Tax=Monoraphidium neglectum TaxID=145388 RepID=A0A0D2KLM0_9CHLO|nr:putative Serine/threonine-protein phosphatase 4 regulatory subunit 3 [Monoraphidium neglectum]KIY96623.1 putative Serine/threonine-protein phosphatase 4 regulatory subunit 3 [Monoraphidium neglectum]|eukprot:XP_013895643.1 putative Serine/threonine-protein phosphatase 4 regulatory subunit 3 [Monoraphidium neglectum]
MMQQQQGFYRVKVYKLNETGGWDDKGTGLVSVGPLETPHQASSSLGLVVLAEDTHKTLLAHRICTDDDIYHRQDDTIITWTDVDVGTDVALSFQEANGCHAIWQHIARLQNEDGRPGVRRRMVDEFESGAQPMDGEYADGAEGGIQGVVELPPAEMGRLEEVAQTMMHVPLMQRERVAQQLMAPGYLRALLDLFRQAEDLEDTASLTALFQTMRSAVLLNDTALLEELLREEHVMDVMGALEHDPETPAGARAQHRQFLKVRASRGAAPPAAAGA